MDCREAIDDLMALAQGELGPSRADTLRTHLESCPHCREEEESIRRTLEMTGLVRNVEMAPPPGLFDRISEQIDEKPKAPSPLPIFPAAPKKVQLPWVAAAALLLSCAAALALFIDPVAKSPAPEAPARLAFVRGEAHAIVNGGELAAVSPGESLPVGAELRVEGLARVDLPGGIKLALDDGAIRVRSSEIVHMNGALAASVTHGCPFSVVTPHGSVRVTGTWFFLDVSAGGTAVQVERGAVEVSNEGGTLTLGPGDAALFGRTAPPRTTGRGTTPSWTRLLSCETLFLDLQQPLPGRPRVLEFRLTNISAKPLFLPRLDADRPHFSLRLESVKNSGVGFVNLAPFLMAGEGSALKGHRPSHELAPGGTLSLKFDVSPLLWMEGRFEVSGVYQAPRGTASGLWVGQALSQGRTIEVKGGK
ncbi:MAG: zf-HC2 domain-containing protein [Planctomycetota bacterium]|jgi:hypothetical protein